MSGSDVRYSAPLLSTLGYVFSHYQRVQWLDPTAICMIMMVENRPAAVAARVS